MDAAQTQEASPEAGNGNDQYLTFILDGEEYGVNILRVQGIQGWGTVTKIPNTPDYVLGVINLRGTIVPIVELRRRFGLESMPFGTTTVVIIVRVHDGERERTVGLVVDAVSDVYTLSQRDVRPAPDYGVSAETRFVSGLATVHDDMVILLDIDLLLSGHDLEAELDAFPAAARGGAGAASGQAVDANVAPAGSEPSVSAAV